MVSVTSSYLCNAAMQHESGLVSVLGAGIRTWEVAEFPSALALTLIADIDWTTDEVDSDHIIRFEVLDTTKNALARGSLAARASRSVVDALPGHNQLAVPLVFQVNKEELLSVELTVDSSSVVALPLWVFSSLPPV